MMTDSNKIYQEEHSIMYKTIEALCGTPETNIILYVNFIQK